MKNIISRAVWLALRPRYFGEFFRKIQYRLNLRRELRQSETSCRLLEELAVSEQEAIRQLFAVTTDACSFESTHQAAVAAAKDRVSKATDKLGGAAAVDFLYHCVRLGKPRRIVETGVAYGWSSLAILTALEENGHGVLASIDFPQFGTSGEAVGLAVPAALRPSWRLHIGPDRTELPKALESLGGIDFCHYDSDKSIAGRRFAYPLLWNKLSQGGLFVSDDIGDNLAFLDFARSVDRDPIIVATGTSGERKFIGAIRK